MKKKTILVVGGAGYIGSQVNKMLHQAQYRTVVLDNLSTGNRQAVKEGIFIEGDMANSALLDQIFSEHQIDAVMHFAAFINVGESVLEPFKYYKNNVFNTINLLEAMRRHAVKIVIFSSTAAVYGNPPNGPAKQLVETLPCHPVNPYGETKLIVEKILREGEYAYGFKSSCLRYFNAAGGDPEGEIKNYQTTSSNLIPLVLKSLKTPSGQLTIFGTDYPTADGTCIRDYVHIYDLGLAHILAMEKLFEGAPTSCYNLGNGNGFSVREVIAAAEKVTGLKVNCVEGARRPGDPSFLVADTNKARRELGWRPRYPALETMIEDAWRAL